MIPRGFSFFLLLILWIPSGCEKAVDSEGKGEIKDLKETLTARSSAERGPVKITVEVYPREARLSDSPCLTVTIEAEEGVKVNKPPFGESMGAFVIRDFREPLPEVRDKKTVLQQIYTLEPTTTGELSIYPISFTFVDDRPRGDGLEHSLETEGLTVEIKSALDTPAPSLDDLKPPSGPLTMEEKTPAYVWWILGSLGSAILLGTVLFVLVRRKKVDLPLEKKLTPRELAYLELQQLMEAGLLEQDIKLFYVEITGIVRRYIERTTGIRAPEQTTEEFLHEMKGHASFSGDESTRLKQFLEAADLVKFAAFEPGREEIEDSFTRAKAFVGLMDGEVAA